MSFSATLSGVSRYKAEQNYDMKIDRETSAAYTSEDSDFLDRAEYFRPLLFLELLVMFLERLLETKNNRRVLKGCGSNVL